MPAPSIDTERDRPQHVAGRRLIGEEGLDGDDEGRQRHFDHAAQRPRRDLSQAQTKLTDAGFTLATPIAVASKLKSGLVVSTHPGARQWLQAEHQGHDLLLQRHDPGAGCDRDDLRPGAVATAGGRPDRQLRERDQRHRPQGRGDLLIAAGGADGSAGRHRQSDRFQRPGAGPGSQRGRACTQPDARAALENVGLGADPVGCLPVDPTTPDGTVVSQDPAPNTPAPPQSTVKIYVARATQTTPCP